MTEGGVERCPETQGRGPAPWGCGGHVEGVNAHKHREAQRRAFMHLPCSCPFQLVTAAGDRAGGPGEPRRVYDGSCRGPCSLPSACLCPQSPRVGPEAMFTPAVPWGKRDTKFYSVVALADTRPASVYDTLVRSNLVFSVPIRFTVLSLLFPSPFPCWSPVHN